MIRFWLQKDYPGCSVNNELQVTRWEAGRLKTIMETPVNGDLSDHGNGEGGKREFQKGLEIEAHRA